MLNLNKRLRLVVVVILLMSLMTMYGATNTANAASLTNASDTLSDSAPTATNVTHTIEFVTGSSTSAGQYMQVLMPDTFTNVLDGGLTCPFPASTTKSVAGPAGGFWDIRCTVNPGESIPLGTSTIIVAGVTNPGAGTKIITINTKTAANAEIETADVVVAIISNITVHASVPATLTFSITELNPGVYINGATTTATSTASSMEFGTLEVNATTTIGQQLSVGTNAANGYTVTVEQDHNLVSDNGADIDSFKDGVAASTTAETWESPLGTLDQENTYGHFGFTTDDASLSGAAYGVGKYKGFGNYLGTDPVDPIEVMHHGGPSIGSAEGVGLARVAYTIRVTALQEAGDYSNTLTYICTPTY